MKTFLDHVCDEVLKNHADDFSKACVVFPTRRAGLILRNKFSRLISKPVFSPAVLSIQDFLQINSETRPADNLELLIELFSVYKKYFPSESFDSFFQWGQIMLNDFNEIDLQMVNASHLFSNIIELKKIESEFGLAEEETMLISNFWKQFSDNDESVVKKTFLKIWQTLPSIYTDYKKHLSAKKIAYEGMAWQKILRKLQSDELQISYSKIYFTGFYAIPVVIEKIISVLQKKQIANILWDVDAYYFDDRSQEAGNYFRKKNSLYQNTNAKYECYTELPKNISITGVPLQAGQAKLAGNFISELFERNKIDEYNSAVVLPDESLLFPVLYSLPEQIDSFNVTMGYPFTASLAASLIDTIYHLQKNAKTSGNGKIKFYSHDVLALLDHPYIHVLAPEKAVLISQQLKKENLSWTENKLFNESTDLKLVFEYCSEPKKIPGYLQNIFNSFPVNETEKKTGVVDSSIVRHLVSELALLEEKLNSLFDEINTETAWQVIRKILRTIKIPFSGEPVRGLQIMGFLETRALDFENIIICSVNETVLPSSSRSASYIPFSLRKGFGFPAIEEQDAVYAYHFYRLLQRAKNIFLLYDTEVKSLTGGEKSRYILQIAHEMKKKLGEKIKINFSLASTVVQAENKNIISIQKTNDIIQKLENRFTVTEKEGSGLSASAISSYIFCKLQFYFRYVVGIKEEETIEDTIEADIFGKVLHSAIQKLYEGEILITSEIIDSLLKKINGVVSDSLNEIFPSSKDNPDGKVYLDKQIISLLVKRILEADKKIAPFEIEMLEGNLQTTIQTDNPLKEVLLKGVFDRVHVKSTTHTIVDYKTGQDKVKNIPVQEDEIEDFFSNHERKASLQLLFYSFIFNKNFPEKNIKAGIYKMKNIESGIQFINAGKPITDSLLAEFEIKLKKFIDDVFNPAIPFNQTEDEKKCEYCPYNTICNR